MKLPDSRSKPYGSSSPVTHRDSGVAGKGLESLGNTLTTLGIEAERNERETQYYDNKGRAVAELSNLKTLVDQTPFYSELELNYMGVEYDESKLVEVDGQKVMPSAHVMDKVYQIGSDGIIDKYTAHGEGHDDINAKVRSELISQKQAPDQASVAVSRYNKTLGEAHTAMMGSIAVDEQIGNLAGIQDTLESAILNDTIDPVNADKLYKSSEQRVVSRGYFDDTNSAESIEELDNIRLNLSTDPLLTSESKTAVINGLTNRENFIRGRKDRDENEKFQQMAFDIDAGKYASAKELQDAIQQATLDGSIDPERHPTQLLDRWQRVPVYKSQQYEYGKNLLLNETSEILVAIQQSDVPNATLKVKIEAAKRKLLKEAQNNPGYSAIFLTRIGQLEDIEKQMLQTNSFSLAMRMIDNYLGVSEWGPTSTDVKAMAKDLMVAEMLRYGDGIGGNADYVKWFEENKDKYEIGESFDAADMEISILDRRMGDFKLSHPPSYNSPILGFSFQWEEIHKANKTGGRAALRTLIQERIRAFVATNPTPDQLAAAQAEVEAFEDSVFMGNSDLRIRKMKEGEADFIAILEENWDSPFREPK